MSSIEEIKDRIKQLITAESLSPAKFADIIGVQRSGISHILSGRNKPSLDVLNKILVSFPDISGDWLITGDGNMLKTGSERKQTEKELFPSDANKPVTVTGPSNVNREEDPPAYGKKPENISESSNRIETQETGKKIDKIVVFFTDRTFREYEPE